MNSIACGNCLLAKKVEVSKIPTNCSHCNSENIRYTSTKWLKEDEKSIVSVYLCTDCQKETYRPMNHLNPIYKEYEV